MAYELDPDSRFICDLLRQRNVYRSMLVEAEEIIQSLLDIPEYDGKSEVSRRRLDIKSRARTFLRVMKGRDDYKEKEIRETSALEP